MNFQENATYSGCWIQMRGKVPFPGLSSCPQYFGRCPLMFLSSLLPLTADLWQALPPAKFTFLSLIYKWCNFYRSWIFLAILWNDRFLHSSNISPSVQIWAPWTGSWDLKKHGTLPLELLWHFIKAIIRPLPSKDSLPQTIYMVSICTLIGNCLGWKKYLYVWNCSCSHPLARCRELSSHSPALQGETTSWLQTSSTENLGHLGGTSWIKVDPHTALH